MSLLAIAYPELSNSDLQIIQNFRKKYDSLYFNIVDPHITLVFPVSDVSESEFTDEIKQQLQGIRPFSFCIRCATINKDSLTDFFHVFLVPDEGLSQMVRLHDKLYSNKLSIYHRLDLPYIPHIGIGNALNGAECKQMVEEWNLNEYTICGKITNIEVVSYDQKSVFTIDTIRLF